MNGWLLDAGNTRLKATRLEGGTDLAGVDIVEYSALGDWAAQIADGQSILLACVANAAVQQKLHEVLPARTTWVRTPAAGLGVRCAYDSCEKWGVDRWLALAAALGFATSDAEARGSSGAGCAVISIGTAMTLDVCSSAGQHLGGWIAPGPQALLEALAPRTALPAAAKDLPMDLGLATDTEDALMMGALQSAVGCIERAVSAAQQQGAQRIFLTGGGAELLQGYLAPLGLEYRPHLVLHGLARLHRELESSARRP